MALREKCPYSELFWSIFSRIRTEYGEIRSISPHPVQMRENANQINSKYAQFLHSVAFNVFAIARDTYTKEIYWGKRWISIVPPNYLRYWCSFYKPKSKIWMISVEIENNITYFLAKVTLTYQIFKFVT